MSLNRFSRNVLHLINVIVLSGFSLQLSMICLEYFKYPTVTLVSIKDSLKETIPPQLAFCADHLWYLYGIPLRQLFSKFEDNSTILFSTTMNPKVSSFQDFF